MDNRLTFLYCRYSLSEKQGRRRIVEAHCWIVRPSVENREVVKYASCFWDVMGREISTEVDDFTLTRKAAIESKGTRTANRHRWMRRES